MKKISVIVTCYNEEENIIPLYERLQKVFKKILYRYEIIYVDNDSTDNSLQIFKNLAKKDRAVKVIIMSRNFGSPQPSFVAGLKHSTGDAIVLLHGDIQDPPELIPKFIKYWEKKYDVVYGIRTDRKGTGLIYNFLYKAFYHVLKKLSYIDIPLHAGEFSLFDKKIKKELMQFKEFDYYLRALRSYVGFKQIGIPYIRDARIHGKSTENFFKSLWWAKTIIINFSLKPLEWISKVAFAVMLLAFLYMAGSIISVFVFKNSPTGIPTIVVLILFLGGIQLLSLSVIAEYLAKIFIEIKGRPRYIIKKTYNLHSEK